MTKEERRRLEADRRHTRIKTAKIALIGTVGILMPTLFYLAALR